MKHSVKHLFMILSLLLALTLVFAGCKGDLKPTEPAESTEQAETEKQKTPAEISETAMTNFLEKIDAGNYVMEVPGYRRTHVYSKDLVWFEYADKNEYSDFVVMGLRHEVFQGFIRGGVLEDVTFLAEGNAMDVAASETPNGWLLEEISEGNIYNLFYNQVEEPLTFLSTSQKLKELLAKYVNYSDRTVKLMEDVYLEFDAEDPTTATIRAKMGRDEVARLFPDDIEITITFGNAAPNALADAWVTSPVYPEARTEWTETDIYIFNSVFLPGYGEDTLPFMPFASYALTNDPKSFFEDETVILRDSRATEEDAAAYRELLKNNGFTEVEEDGVTYFRKLLREEFHCYASVTVDFNAGVDVVANRYYDAPVYDGLEEINEVLREFDFLELTLDLPFSNYTAVNNADSSTESWLYFFQYDLMLEVTADLGEEENVKKALPEMVQAYLDAGYTEVYSSLVEGDDSYYYESPDGARSFRYRENGDGTISFLYKSEKYVPKAEAEARIAAAGFPAITLENYVSCRDQALFNKMRYNVDYALFLTPSLQFADDTEGSAFLDAYAEKLDAAGFLPVPPSNVGSLRENAFLNEDTGLKVCFDLNGGLIFFEFIQDAPEE